MLHVFTCAQSAHVRQEAKISALQTSENGERTSGIYQSFSLSRLSLSVMSTFHIIMHYPYCDLYVLFQQRLKSSQKDKVRQFVAFTQTGEKTAINCLCAHDWKLDVAVDNYFMAPDRYSATESRSSVDKRKIEALWQRYKGE